MQVSNQTAPATSKPSKANPPKASVQSPEFSIKSAPAKDEVTFSGRKDRIKRERKAQREKEAKLEAEKRIAPIREQALRVAVQTQPILADFLADQQGHPDSDLLALQFLKMGAHPNLKSKEHGYPPLSMATNFHQPVVMKALVKAGADPNLKSDNTEESALHIAVQNRDKGAFNFLLENGANPEAKDWQGDTPLFQALAQEETDFVEKMLNLDANPDAKNGIGNSLLLTAVGTGQKEMAKLILNKGGNPNVQDPQGVTPLVFALTQNNFELAHQLLKKGANPLLGDNDDFTPLQHVQVSGDAGMIALFNRYVLNQQNP